MHIYVERSGDDGFDATRFDCYVLAGVVCPESELPAIDDYVASATRTWGVGELHGAQLDREKLIEICEFIGAASVSALVHVTDTQMMTKPVIRAFRLKQAEQIESELVRWRGAGGSSARVAADLTNLAKAARFTSRLSDTEFVQASMLPDLLRDVVQRAIDRFESDEWRDAFERFDFVFDEKLPGKLSSGQKFANLMYMPVLGSNKRIVLRIPQHWRDTGHPYAVNSNDGSYTRVDALFANGLATRASHDIAGLQLADVIAHVVRQAVLRPNAIDRVLTASVPGLPRYAGRVRGTRRTRRRGRRAGVPSGWRRPRSTDRRCGAADARRGRSLGTGSEAARRAQLFRHRRVGSPTPAIDRASSPTLRGPQPVARAPYLASATVCGTTTITRLTVCFP